MAFSLQAIAEDAPRNRRRAEHLQLGRSIEGLLDVVRAMDTENLAANALALGCFPMVEHVRPLKGVDRMQIPCIRHPDERWPLP
jgi:hypothetical protein